MPMSDAKFVWMNGELVPWERATLHVSSHALHYGTGAFEGIRCYDTAHGPAVFRLREHLQRLFASAGMYGIGIPYTEAELIEAVSSLIRANGFSGCYVRPIVYFGSDTLNLHPKKCPIQVAILAWPWGAYLGAEGVNKGVRVTVSSWKKFDSGAIPATAKACGQYVNSVLAVREAVQRGFDEALLLTADGYLSEGSGENLFIVRNGRVLTNDDRSSILMGITRDAVITIARDLGLPVEIAALRLRDLEEADEAFFTGTAVEVTPVREVDGRAIGNGRWPVMQKIQARFADAVSGRDRCYASWLTPVAALPARPQPAQAQGIAAPPL